MAKLSPRERETIILMNDSGEPARVTTCQKKVIAHMKKHFGPGKPLSENQGRNGYQRWDIPKDRVRLPRPKSKARAEAAAAAARARRAE